MQILEENLLWVEKVPPDVRANIIASADANGDGVITQDEFIRLASGRNIPGFNRRRRRALRELLKQTVEFIVPNKYQYEFSSKKINEKNLLTRFLPFSLGTMTSIPAARRHSSCSAFP